MNRPLRFRKRPVAVEAMHWAGTAETATPVIDWVLRNDGSAVYTCVDTDACTASEHNDTPHVIRIRTLEGPMAADPDGWVVRGVANEFYPVKGGIFRVTYRPVRSTRWRRWLEVARQRLRSWYDGRKLT